MNKKICFRLYCTVMGILLLVTVHPAWTQEQNETGNMTGNATEQQVQEKPKDVFKLEESIIKSLESRIPEEKFKQLEELKDKEFAEIQLTEALEAIAFSKEEVETVLNLVRERREFIEAIKKAAPVALAMDRADVEMKKNEKILEETQQEDERKKLAKEIKDLHKVFKRQEYQLSRIISDIDGTQTEQVAAVLKDAERKSDEIDIITRYILNHALLINKLRTLREIDESIDSINKEIGKAGQKLKDASSEEEKKRIKEYLSDLNKRLTKTKKNISVLTTGIDYSTFLKKEGKEVDWEKELKEIFSPIIVELKETTERPRKMERLRSNILSLERRIPQVRQATKNLDKFLEYSRDKKVTNRLKWWQEYWQQLEKEFSTQLEADKDQLLQTENERKSLLASFKIFFDSFVKNRGKNLFFALLAFIGIYLFFRLLQRLIWKISPIHRSSKYMFWANLVDVMFYALTFLVATGALVTVLFTSGDWLILAIVMLLVLGMIWGARNTLPHFVEQIKLLLGFGPVRHGEKIMIDGIAYRVEMMGVYSYLKNPLLTGGTLRLPLKDLVGMRSQPYDEREPWFPCKEGDYVLIDGLSTWRQVKLQTPHVVEFEWYEMLESVPTSSFMIQKIFNLSVAPFWVGFGFELSYKHRREILNDICEKLTAITEQELQKTSFAEHVIAPWIDFENFSASSLILTYWVQMKKEAAGSYPTVKRALRKIALKAANKYDLEIIQLHHIDVHHPDEAKALLNNSGPAA